MDEVFENICRGIAQSIGSSNSANEIVLEYNSDKSAAAANRRASGCRGDNRLDCVGMFGEGWECDEFPFANTAQGGARAATMCVPATDNAIVGSTWGAKVRGNSTGAKFRFKISGLNCTDVSTTISPRDVQLAPRAPVLTGRGIMHTLRQAGGSAIIRNDTKSVVVDGTIFGSVAEGKYAVIFPIPTPDESTFQGVLKLTWTIDATMSAISHGMIIDDDGTTYAE
jgi:hypothetical protein